MRLIIAGSRTFNNYDEAHDVIMEAIIKWDVDVEEIVLGGAEGADQLGERFAHEHDIPCTVFDADWGMHGKAAGAIRNKQMAEYGDALVAFWDGKSPVTKNMIDNATKLELPTLVYEVV